MADCGGVRRRDHARSDCVETPLKRFKKILVDVDLSWGERHVSDELSAPNAEAVRQAMWLTKLNSASIDFLFMLDSSAKAQ